MLRRLLLLALSSTALVLASVMPQASALGPTREIHPSQGDGVIADQCPFPVLGHVDGGEVITTFTDAMGVPVKQITRFPGNRLTLTNMDTGASVNVMGTGSTQIRAESDGGLVVSIVGHGPFFPNPLTGEPGIWYLSGRGRATFDADNVMTSATITGRLVDLCDQIAS